MVSSERERNARNSGVADVTVAPTLGEANDARGFESEALGALRRSGGAAYLPCCGVLRWVQEGMEVDGRGIDAANLGDVAVVD